MTTNQTLGLVIAAIIIIGGAWYLFAPKSTQAPAPAQETVQDTSGEQGQPTTVTTTTSTTTTNVTAPTTPVTVTYTDSGFSPKTVTVGAGTKVTWVNNSSHTMWIGSDEHPSHTDYDNTSRTSHCVNNAPSSSSVFDECTAIGKGGSWSFTFGKTGTWGYHNHTGANDTGSVTVVPAVSATTVQVQVQAQ
ncbi:MAG: plastocyanin/azurin family copper-binding protein [bacterium]